MSWLPLSNIVAVAEKAGAPLRIRVIRFPVNTADARDIRGSAGPPPRPGSFVTVNGLKWFLEGAPCEETGAIRHPYGDGTVAKLPYAPEAVRAMLHDGVKQGQPLLFHAGGARAIEELFTAMESMPDVDWTQRRVRIEHGDELYPEMFPRARRLGIVLVQNPEHLDVPPGMDVAAVRRILGVQPGDVIQPMRSVLEAGIRFALGTDGAENPFRNILLASTHPLNPREALTREQAVTAFTRGAAYAEFAEKEKGTLAPGMLADFVVLSKDVFTAPADQVPDIRSVLTVIGGKVAFDATAADAGVQ
jgi:predicted amidohydrolase YtcJ